METWGYVPAVSEDDDLEKHSPSRSHSYVDLYSPTAMSVVEGEEFRSFVCKNADDYTGTRGKITVEK